MKPNVMKYSITPILISIGLLTGCNESRDPFTSTLAPVVQTPSVESSSPPQNGHASESGGVIDGSGGNTFKSSALEVERALDQLLPRLQIVSYRLKSTYDVGTKPPPTYSPKGNWEVFRGSLTEEEFVRAEAMWHAILSSNNRHGKSVDELLSSGFLKIKRQKTSCHSPDGPVDATAEETGELCFSMQRLMQVSPSALPIETTALAFHELAHVYSYSESDAQLLQKHFIYINEGLILLIDNENKRQWVETLNKLTSTFSRLQKDWTGLRMVDHHSFRDSQDYHSLSSAFFSLGRLDVILDDLWSKIFRRAPLDLMEKRAKLVQLISVLGLKMKPSHIDYDNGDYSKELLWKKESADENLRSAEEILSSLSNGLASWILARDLSDSEIKWLRAGQLNFNMANKGQVNEPFLGTYNEAFGWVDF